MDTISSERIMGILEAVQNKPGTCQTCGKLHCTSIHPAAIESGGIEKQMQTTPHEYESGASSYCLHCDLPKRAAIHGASLPDPLLAAANQRAERWKELCRSLMNGMQSVFSSYELQIDGKATPIIESAGMYKCCVDALKTIPNPADGASMQCKCGTLAEYRNNTWRAV